jgi:hypothetical protein
METYYLTYRAWQQYKWNTAGNRNIGRHKAAIKLSRDIALAKVFAEDDRHTIYRYGYLQIGVDKQRGAIVDVHQEYAIEPTEIDEAERERLNIELGLYKKQEVE